jgi:hypothetical protein
MKTWRQRIVEARQRGGFTDEDRRRALRWCTCAVGEQRRMLGAKVIRYQVGWGGNESACGVYGPSDSGLLMPGGDFAYVVRNNAFDDADRLLDKIEDRVLQLKREATS